MSRARRTAAKKPRSLGKSLGLLLLVNIVPVIVLAVLAFKYQAGEIEIREDQVPEGTQQTLMWVGGILVALFVVASFSLPVAHDGVKSVQAQLRRGGAVLRGEQEGSKALSILSWPFLAVAFGLGGLARLALIFLSFTLIALLILFLCRLKWPDLAQAQIDAVIDWSAERVG